MGLFDFFKDKFSTGGIKVRLAVPKKFIWGDKTIMCTVTLTGHKAEPRTVTSLIFELEDELGQEETQNKDVVHPEFGTRVRVMWEREGTIQLAPGQNVTLEIPFIVAEEESGATSGAAEQEGGTRLGKFASAAGRLAPKLGLVTDPGRIPLYRVTVQAPEQGANNVARHSRPIRQGTGFSINHTLRL